MKKQALAVLSIISFGIIAGCGGGGSSPAAVATTSAISGTVADGYLVSATVFLDKNGNYQLETGEPSTTTDANGGYTLNINSVDVGKYPIVAMAIKEQTIDKDTNQTVPNSYMLSMPATAVSGVVNSNFISPMSTLLWEKMQANPGMTLANAMTQLRNQMNLPDGIDMMADYVVGSLSGANSAQYQAMHVNAQKMAGLMAGQAGLVMNGSGMNVNSYRNMMGTINSNMSAIAANAINSPFLTSMMSQMQTQLGAIPMTGGFTNYSGMFRNMTSYRYFWNTTGGTTTPTTPMSGGMM
jgi:hypothetical protein